MYLKFRRTALFCLIMIHFFSAASWSSDDGGHKTAEPAVPKKRTSEESYAAVSGKVAALEAKIRSAEQEIQKLVGIKAKTSNPQQVNETIKSMLVLHGELKKNIEEYEKQRSLLRYRYPEKAMSEGREYERLELKSLEEMEGAAGLSVAVRKTLQKVRLQYRDSETSPGLAGDASATRDHDRRPASSKKPSLLEPVILKK